MNLQKILVLLAGTFVIAAIVTYQVRSRRPAAPRGAVISQPSTPAQSPATTPAAAAQATAPAAKISIPAGWGRNPFLTIEEIQKLNQPREVVVTPPTPAPRPALPRYEVTAIIMNEKGGWAVVSPGSRVIRVGDRLGSETVRQIKEESIVLERDGETREVALKPSSLEIQQIPRG